jgi:hypothetical protein
MVKYCPRCGFQNPDDAMYCIRCGFPLTQPVYQPTVQQPPVSPPPYPQPPSAGGKKGGRKLVPIIGVALAIIVIIAALILVLPLFHHTTPTKLQNYQVVLNLLNGQQYFGVPHVYQGDNDGSPTSQWPVYYGPNNASQYWSLAGISSNQPVLELVPHTPSWASGAMFWSETYSGGLVKITFIGTQTTMGDGFIIYLFLKPTKWAVSPNYNYTIPYNSTAGEGWITYPPGYPSRVEADVIYPQSSTPYIVVQWDPFWQFEGYTQSGATGQWNVWIVSNPSGNNASITPNPSPNLSGYTGIGLPYAGWDGIGTGAFQPNPGDRINITVTYDPSTNTLTGIAMDLNTGQSANFTLNLGNYYTPPSSGNYVFGVGATGPHWALLYVAMIGNVKSPSPTYYSVNSSMTNSVEPSHSALLIWVMVAVIVVLVLIIALLMVRRRKQ